MSRDEAAALLGVRSHDDPAVVRRAFRLWARSAHPDAGGSAGELDRLRRARDVLLMAARVRSAPPPPRPRLLEVLSRPAPGRLIVLAIGLALTCAAGAIPALLGADDPGAAGPDVTLVLAAGPAALLACALGILLADSVSNPHADAGHRVVLLGWGWTIGTIGAITVAGITGRSLVEVLPVLAVPLVAAVSWLISPRPWSARPRMPG